MPAVLGTEDSLDLGKQHRKQTLYRLDGGSGTDDNLIWLLGRGYQVLAKGYSGQRAHAWGQRVSRWDPYSPDCWLGSMTSPVDFGRPVRILVRRCLRNGRLKHSYYVTTLSFPSKKALAEGTPVAMDAYNYRGAAEIEQFREDKSGLHLSARRKLSFTSPESNYLAKRFGSRLVG